MEDWKMGTRYNVFYISLETALNKYGISFQFVSSIKSISLISKTIVVLDQEFQYHQMKEDVFYSSQGLNSDKNYTIAGPERAICDSLYIYPNITFDNLKNINTDKLKEISQMYFNLSLEKRVNRIIKSKG